MRLQSNYVGTTLAVLFLMALSVVHVEGKEVSSANTCDKLTFNKCMLPENTILDTIDVDSEEDCQLYCTEMYTDVCLFFTYFPNNGTCLLINHPFDLYLASCEEFSVPSNSTITHLNGYVDPCKTSFEMSCEFLGDRLGSLQNVPSSENCQVACSHTVGCQCAFYSKPTMDCVLLSSSQRSCDALLSPPNPSVHEFREPTSTLFTPFDMALTNNSTTNPTPAKSLKLLAVAGANNDIGFLFEVELFNPFVSENHCQKPPAYPYDIDGLCGAQQMFCDFRQRCFYLEDGQWKRTFNTAYDRGFAACAYLPNNSFYISGGQGVHTNTFSTSEIKIEKFHPFVPSTDMPERVNAHCISNVNDTHIFYAGSYVGDQKAAYLVNIENDQFEFTKLPPMNNDRWGAACGVIVTPSSSIPEFLVSGGDSETTHGIATTSEIFSFVSYRWSQGPALPRGYRFGGYFSNPEHTLIMVGGYDEHNNDCVDTIAYKKEENLFEQLPGSLKTARHYFGLGGVETEEDC